MTGIHPLCHDDGLRFAEAWEAADHDDKLSSDAAKVRRYSPSFPEVSTYLSAQLMLSSLITCVTDLERKGIIKAHKTQKNEL